MSAMAYGVLIGVAGFGVELIEVQDNCSKKAEAEAKMLKRVKRYMYGL